MIDGCSCGRGPLHREIVDRHIVRNAAQKRSSLELLVAGAMGMETPASPPRDLVRHKKTGSLAAGSMGHSLTDWDAAKGRATLRNAVTWQKLRPPQTLRRRSSQPYFANGGMRDSNARPSIFFRTAEKMARMERETGSSRAGFHVYEDCDGGARG